MLRGYLALFVLLILPLCAETGKVVSVHDGGKAPKAEDYAKLEKGEREARKGLWRELGSKKAPVAPWAFRKSDETRKSN